MYLGRVRRATCFYREAVVELPFVAKVSSAQARLTRALPLPFVSFSFVVTASMGKHFSPIELDNTHRWKSESCSPAGIHRRLVADRRRKRLAGPDLTTVRRYVKGKTFKRAAVESRGRKRVLSDTNLAAIDGVARNSSPKLTAIGGSRGPR